jgi:hypothetical protein
METLAKKINRLEYKIRLKVTEIGVGGITENCFYDDWYP